MPHDAGSRRSYPPSMADTLTTVTSFDSETATMRADNYLGEDAFTSVSACKVDHFDKDVEKGFLKFRRNAPSSTPEPFRDFQGPFTIHRVITLIWMIGLSTAIYFLQRVIWPPNNNSSPYRDTWIANPYLGFILLIAFPAAALTLVGSLWYNFSYDLNAVQPAQHCRVVFRIVSRGINQECLTATIRSCQEEMFKNAYFPYLIEVVTDADVFEAPDDDDVVHTRVPPTYITENGTLFKARALHYACEYSPIPGDTWVVHLDEETRLTSSAIKGVAAMISDCEKKGDLDRIGQGTILYHRAFETHPFLTLADSRRTGDDFGHFFLQHRLGFTMFGLHGAFIVCRQATEASIGFDIGPEGSITEDAWWILLAMQKGYRTTWVDGFLEEQATESLSDFLKQRRRWNYGLVKVVMQNPVPFYYRLCLGWFVMTWMLVPFLLPLQLGYTISLIVLELPIPEYFRIPTVFIVATQFYAYFIGWVVNVRECSKISKWKLPFWTILQVILVPVFLLMEIASVISSFFACCTQNGRGFHVVQKSVTAKQSDSSNQDDDCDHDKDDKDEESDE